MSEQKGKQGVGGGGGDKTLQLVRCFDLAYLSALQAKGKVLRE